MQIIFLWNLCHISYNVYNIVEDNIWWVFSVRLSNMSMGYKHDSLTRYCQTNTSITPLLRTKSKMGVLESPL